MVITFLDVTNNCTFAPIMAIDAIPLMKIWEVTTPVVGSTHKLKYSLFYGASGKRLVGYANERGKGDHRHIEDRQERYAFKTVELLIADFLADVRGLRGER